LSLLAVPLAAGAQPGGKVWWIGVLASAVVKFHVLME
jgi:hypothetical protein